MPGLARPLNPNNPMKTMTKISCVAALIALLLQGCAALVVGGVAAAAGAGVVVYRNGELKSTDSVSIDRAWVATEKAVQAMEFKPVSSTKDALGAKYEGVGAADKRVIVALKSTGEKMTEVRIRVGLVGDEAAARTVLAKIQSQY